MTTDPNTPNPFGPEWDEQADRLLGTTQYDPELGKRVARDAQRLVAGELSEAEFHQKYHEAYLNEFNVDNRPITPGGDVGDTPGGDTGETLRGSVPLPTTDQPVSRRTFLKLAGGGAAALAVSGSLMRMIPSVSAAGSAAPEQSEGSGSVQWGMVIDLERCTGCLACVDACHRENNTSPGVHWMYIFAYEDENQDGVNFLLRMCQHCSNPPCVKVCPVMARHKREKDGLVLTDYDICIGCRYCEVACPYGANYFQWEEPRPEQGYRYSSRKDYRGRTVEGNPPRGVMGKCTFCPQRQDSEWKKGTAACQLGCPHDVIHVGDMNDPNSVPYQYLEKRKQEKGGYISTFRLMEGLGTKPNMLFIGQQPSKHAKQVKGPTTYEDWGFVDERGTLLESPRPWFARVFGG